MLGVVCWGVAHRWRAELQVEEERKESESTIHGGD